MALCAVALPEAQALAQGNPFGVARPEPAMSPQSGPLAGLFAWIAAQQAALYTGLSGLVAAFRTDPWAGLALVGLSFGYGILHAAGPGHGKAVISSYLIASGETARRGVVLSFAAALLQAMTAIALVGVFAIALRATSLAITRATGLIEIVSFALVTALGAWLVMAKGAALLRATAGTQGQLQTGGTVAISHHSHTASCGHSHGPDPAALGGAFSLRRAAAAVAAVGLRPCTGAVLVLVFAFSQGVFGIGIASALAMAVGTGLTVAVLAGFAVGARGLALRLADGGSGWAMAALHVLELAAALVVLLFGLVLLGGALAG